MKQAQRAELAELQDHRASMLQQYIAPLAPYLADDAVTEICVNRPNEIWTESLAGWTRVEAPTLSFETCMQLARLIANYNSKSINGDSPGLSASLPNGERVQIVVPPACETGTVTITIRKPSRFDPTLDQLHVAGAFDLCESVSEGLRPFETELLRLHAEGRIKDFLNQAVRHRRNILIVGKTGSGKTTLTKTLIRSIPASERLVTIEDVHELFLHHHANKVHLFYGHEADGSVNMSAKQALQSCLRMKPDRILLAELRGDEAWEFIKSVNTGHPGSISTMHANGALEAFEQLTALIKDSPTGAHLDTAYIRRRLFTTIDIVLYYEQRQLRELYYDPLRKRQADA